MIVYAAVMCLLFPIGVPLYYAAALFRSRNELPTPLLRGSVHLISVLELTINEVVGGELTESSLAHQFSVSSL